jgi:hypothetical protein
MAVCRRNFHGRLIAFAMALGAMSLTSGWVFYQDDRLPSHLAMVGTLAVELPEGRGAGTATLVDECGILTNFHVVFGPWYVTALRSPSHDFVGTFTLTEVTLPDGTYPTARATPVVWGLYEGPDRQIRNPKEDWAYLVLDRCLGGEYGYLRLRSTDADELDAGNNGFAAVGYSTGRQMIDPSCSVHVDKTRADVWRHDCALLPGDSGGPILKRGTLTMNALASSFMSDSKECLRRGTTVGDVVPDWHDTCANIAVPLSSAVLDLVEAAHVAVGTQRLLERLGYDAGPLGAIDDERATDAVRRVQHDMGWSVTGVPTDALRKILILQLPTT